MTTASGYSLPPGGIGWAIECLKAGQSVRRKMWMPGEHIVWGPDLGVFWADTEEPVVIQHSWLFADDWELAG